MKILHTTLHSPFPWKWLRIFWKNSGGNVTSGRKREIDNMWKVQWKIWRLLLNAEGCQACYILYIYTMVCILYIHTIVVNQSSSKVIFSQHGKKLYGLFLRYEVAPLQLPLSRHHVIGLQSGPKVWHLPQSGSPEQEYWIK